MRTKDGMPVNSILQMRMLLGQRRLSEWSYKRRLKKTVSSYGYPSRSSFDRTITDLSNKMYSYLTESETILGYIIEGSPSQVYRTTEELRDSWTFKYGVIKGISKNIVVRSYCETSYTKDKRYTTPKVWVDEVLQNDVEFLKRLTTLKYHLTDGKEVSIEVTNEVMLHIMKEGNQVSVARYKQ